MCGRVWRPEGSTGRATGWTPDTTRPRRRPRQRLKDQITKNTLSLEVNNGEELARDRDGWRQASVAEMNLNWFVKAERKKCHQIHQKINLITVNCFRYRTRFPSVARCVLCTIVLYCTADPPVFVVRLHRFVCRQSKEVIGYCFRTERAICINPICASPSLSPPPFSRRQQLTLRQVVSSACALAFRTSPKRSRRTAACSDESTGIRQRSVAVSPPPSGTWPAARAAVRVSSISFRRCPGCRSTGRAQTCRPTRIWWRPASPISRVRLGVRRPDHANLIDYTTLFQ